MPIGTHKELRHRGEPLVEYPGADLWKAVGGSDGVAALIKDLYRRIEQDELLRVVFPHFNSGEATPFFMQWFGGSRGYSDDLAGGLLRRHQHRYISPKAAAAWLRCMREALVARGLDAEQIMRPLARIAKAMIHSPETEAQRTSQELRRRPGCGAGAVRDAAGRRRQRTHGQCPQGAWRRTERSQAGAACTTARWPGSRRTATARRFLS